MPAERSIASSCSASRPVCNRSGHTYPGHDRLADLLATDWSPDEVRIVGDAIYTLCATKYSDSKFNNDFFERKLHVAATTRNFNTMTRLVALSTALAVAEATLRAATEPRRPTHA